MQCKSLRSLGKTGHNISMGVPLHSPYLHTCLLLMLLMSTLYTYDCLYIIKFVITSISRYGKGKRGFVWRLVVMTPLRRSGMARILKESHSFTCTPCVHLLME